jgi:hypothetical protein
MTYTLMLTYSYTCAHLVDRMTCNKKLCCIISAMMQWCIMVSAFIDIESGLVMNIVGHIKPNDQRTS